MPNVHSHHEGRAVRVLAPKSLAYPPDFPGWGHPDAAAYLRPIPAGARGVVACVESHGSNPWTRYTVVFDGGLRATGLVLGTDIEFASACSRFRQVWDNRHLCSACGQLAERHSAEAIAAGQRPDRRDYKERGL